VGQLALEALKDPTNIEIQRIATASEIIGWIVRSGISMADEPGPGCGRRIRREHHSSAGRMT